MHTMYDVHTWQLHDEGHMNNKSAFNTVCDKLISTAHMNSKSTFDTFCGGHKCKKLNMAQSVSLQTASWAVMPLDGRQWQLN